jgi:hypothetical protein
MSVDGPLATAAAPPSGDLFGQVWPWLAALLLVVCAGGLVIYLLRRSMDRPESGPGEAFTLHQLRELHASGALSDEEFERAKASIIGRMTAADARERNAAEPEEPGGGD